ncbi:Signal recognition particle, SRP54 subunit, M-domain protein domain protein, partial [mine drainage metagenome]
QKLGGMASLMDKLPTAVQKGAVRPEQADQDVRRQIAIINSMTPRERVSPALIDGSRRRRIARGAGVQVQDVNRLMKQFLQMQKMMKQMRGGAHAPAPRGAAGPDALGRPAVPGAPPD